MRILKMITAAAVLTVATQGFALTKEACNNKSGVGIKNKTAYSPEKKEKPKTKGQNGTGVS